MRVCEVGVCVYKNFTTVSFVICTRYVYRLYIRIDRSFGGSMILYSTVSLKAHTCPLTLGCHFLFYFLGGFPSVRSTTAI